MGKKNPSDKVPGMVGNFDRTGRDPDASHGAGREEFPHAAAPDAGRQGSWTICEACAIDEFQNGKKGYTPRHFS